MKKLFGNLFQIKKFIKFFHKNKTLFSNEMSQKKTLFGTSLTSISISISLLTKKKAESFSTDKLIPNFEEYKIAIEKFHKE